MEMLRPYYVVLTAVALFVALSLPSANAAGAPAPAPMPTSDAKSVDQGIAYLLMLLALVITYLWN